MCPNADFIMDGNYICKLDGSPCDSDAGGDCNKTIKDEDDENYIPF